MAPVSVSSTADGELDVALLGEIDYTNAGPVNEVIRDAVAQAAPRVVRLDLEKLTFLDSSGIGVLVNALKAAQASGADFQVRRPNPKILDQLYITGLIDIIPVDPV